MFIGKKSLTKISLVFITILIFILIPAVSDPLPSVTNQYNQSQTITITGTNSTIPNNLDLIDALTYNDTNTTLFYDSFNGWGVGTTNCNQGTSGWSLCRVVGTIANWGANNTLVPSMINSSDKKVLEGNDVDTGDVGTIIKCVDTSSYSLLYTDYALGHSALDANEYINVTINTTGNVYTNLKGVGDSVASVLTYYSNNITNYISSSTCINVTMVGTGSGAASDRGFLDDFKIIGASPLYRAEIEHNATGVTWSGILNSINVSVNFTTNVTSAFNLTIYNFNSGTWNYTPCNGGQVTANNWNNWWCNVTSNPSYYNSTDGKIRVRLNGTVAHTGAALIREDYVQYYVNYTPVDSVLPAWSQAQDNSSYKVYRGQVVNISTLWSDSGGGQLDKSWLSTNETGSWINYTANPYPIRALSGTGPSLVNWTWQNQTGAPRVIGWIIYTNDTANNINGTDNPGNVRRNFTMWGWSNTSWSFPSGSVSGIVPLTCFVNDTNATGPGPISGYDVNFYNVSSTAETYLGKNYTNSSGYAIYYWNTNGLTAGTYYPKCNITSNSTLFYNSSEYYQANTTISLANIVEITLSQTLSEGIIFGDVTVNTIGNPARNNSHPETRYNLTVGSSSTQNLDFYVKLNESFGAGIYVNESSSTTSNSTGFSTNTTVDTTWLILGNSTLNCTNLGTGNNCWIRMYFDVSTGVTSGYRQKNFTICGVTTGSSSNICG